MKGLCWSPRLRQPAPLRPPPVGPARPACALWAGRLRTLTPALLRTPWPGWAVTFRRLFPKASSSSRHGCWSTAAAEGWNNLLSSSLPLLPGSRRNLRNDLLVAADSITNTVSSLVKELHSGKPHTCLHTGSKGRRRPPHPNIQLFTIPSIGLGVKSLLFPHQMTSGRKRRDCSTGRTEVNEPPVPNG